MSHLILVIVPREVQILTYHEKSVLQDHFKGMNKDFQSLIIKTTVEQGGDFSLQEKELRMIPEGLDSVSEGLQGVEGISVC